MSLWPHQSRALAEIAQAKRAGHNRICITSPTGMGKSRIICEQLALDAENDESAVIYTNRRLLIDQLRRVLREHGIDYGTRAAGHKPEFEKLIQISSLPTEQSRSLKKGSWNLHPAQNVYIDEAHLNSAKVAQAIASAHVNSGGTLLGFTATPIEIGHMYEHLIVAGRNSDGRACGALVPAMHYGPDEPQLDEYTPSQKTGDYSANQLKKAMLGEIDLNEVEPQGRAKVLMGRVLEYYHRLNPEQRPTILFGPGKAEALWFCKQFERAGIAAAHIDGAICYVDGEEHKTSALLRQQIIDAVKSGAIKVLTNRFVLREGIDIPEVSHLILATCFGSLQSYLQSCGRGLRSADGKSICTIQDHGGNWHRLGSVNADRIWNMSDLAYLTTAMRLEEFRQPPDVKPPEPIMCPQCTGIRGSGQRCPHCGYEQDLGRRVSRRVIQTNGSLKEYSGDIYKPRVPSMKSDTHKKWERMYYRSLKANMTFTQARGLFFRENYYWPPQDLPLMPQRNVDWFRKVKDVPRHTLS